jgi:hypothetical protein
MVDGGTRTVNGNTLMSTGDGTLTVSSGNMPSSAWRSIYITPQHHHPQHDLVALSPA